MPWIPMLTLHLPDSRVVLLFASFVKWLCGWNCKCFGMAQVKPLGFRQMHVQSLGVGMPVQTCSPLSYSYTRLQTIVAPLGLWKHFAGNC